MIACATLTPDSFGYFVISFSELVKLLLQRLSGIQYNEIGLQNHRLLLALIEISAHAYRNTQDIQSPDTQGEKEKGQGSPALRDTSLLFRMSSAPEVAFLRSSFWSEHQA